MVFLGGLAAIAAGGPEAAAGPVCVPGSTTAPITADAKVSSVHPNRHYGRRDTWGLNYAPTTARSFLEFDLPTIPVGCSVSKATLGLRGTLSGQPNPPDSWPGAFVEMTLVRRDWTEAAITWTNKPGGHGCVAENFEYAHPDSWQITGIVQQAYECLRNGGLAEWNGLKARGWSPRGRGAKWRLVVDSRESAHPPTIEISWE